MPRMSASNLAIAADSRPLRLKTSTTEDNIENRAQDGADDRQHQSAKPIFAVEKTVLLLRMPLHR